MTHCAKIRTWQDTLQRWTRVFSLLLLATSVHAEMNLLERLTRKPHSSDQFLSVDQAFAFSYRLDGHQLRLSWKLAPGYYLYRDRIELKILTPGATVGPLQFSTQGNLKNDPYFGQVTIFSTDLELSAPITLPDKATTAAELQVSYQGCAEAGLCYPPQRHSLLFSPSAAPDQKD